MALPSAVEGATHTPRTITWLREDETPQDLTGATLTATRRNLRTNAVAAFDAAAFVVLDGAAGTMTWTLVPADVEAGAWEVQIVATYGAGDDEATLADTWLVYPRHEVAA